MCRGQAIALATLTNFGSNFLVSLLLPSVQEQIGQGGECCQLPMSLSCMQELPAGWSAAGMRLAVPAQTNHFVPCAAATYFTFAVIGIVAVATINAIVPETKVGLHFGIICLSSSFGHMLQSSM